MVRQRSFNAGDFWRRRAYGPIRAVSTASRQLSLWSFTTAGGECGWGSTRTGC
jgi:hypothetical protein